MLDSQDIELLQSMIVTTFEKQFAEQNLKWEQRLDERFAEHDKVWEQKLNEQFKQRFAEHDKVWEQKLNEQFKQRFAEHDKVWEQKLNNILDKRFNESENMILEELDRVEVRLTGRIDKLQKNVEEVNDFFRIALLERGNYQLLEERVSSLESRICSL